MFQRSCRLRPKQDRPRSDRNVYWHFLNLFISSGTLLTCPQGIELIGELAGGGRRHQGRDPLLSLAPVRQRRLDRGLARGREMGDALALVDVPTLDPNQAAARNKVGSCWKDGSSESRPNGYATGMTY